MTPEEIIASITKNNDQWTIKFLQNLRMLASELGGFMPMSADKVIDALALSTEGWTADHVHKLRQIATAIESTIDDPYGVEKTVQDIPDGLRLKTQLSTWDYPLVNNERLLTRTTDELWLLLAKLGNTHLVGDFVVYILNGQPILGVTHLRHPNGNPDVLGISGRYGGSAFGEYRFRRDEVVGIIEQ